MSGEKLQLSPRPEEGLGLPAPLGALSGGRSTVACLSWLRGDGIQSDLWGAWLCYECLKVAGSLSGVLQV